jgi:protein-disulfide isomerase
MSTEPLPPDPEQIIAPTPPSRRRVLGMAAGVILVVVAVVLCLRIIFKPEAPTETAVTGLPVLGDPKAPLTIFEYASFACEHCAHVQPIVKEVMSRYEGKVKLVYIHYVLGSMSNHLRAAQAGICAAEQGKFWEFEQIMFERQKSWVQDANPLPLWLLYASQVGMDTNKLTRCMDSEATQQALQQQIMMGAGQMVQRTPTFLIGNTPLVNPGSVNDFVRVIDKELAALKKG